MAPEQKMAWFLILVYAAGFIAFGLLIPIVGVPLAFVAFFVLGLGFLTPLIPRIFRNKREPSEVVEDERDKLIARKATLGGAMLSYGTFVLACLIPAGIYEYRDQEMIPVGVLHNIVGAGVIVFFLARSIGVLVLYRWGKGSSEG